MIQDKVVVITGGSSGIGYSTAKALAKKGAKIVAGARRLNKLSNKYINKGKNVVVDFICPNKDSFNNFKADFVVWVDTIKKGRHIRKHLDDINPIFKKPKKFNLRVTSKDVKVWRIILLDILKKSQILFLIHLVL